MEAEVLVRRARTRVGQRGYALRMAAFGLATMPGLRQAIPAAVRSRLIAPMIYALVPGPAENLLYAGTPPSPADK